MAQGGLAVGQDQVQQLIGLRDAALLEQGLSVPACRLEGVGVVESPTAPRQFPGLLEQSLSVGSPAIGPEGTRMVGHGNEGSRMFRSEDTTCLGRRRFV